MQLKKVIYNISISDQVVMRVSIFHNSIKNALGQTQPKMVCPADANLASKVIFEGGAHSHIIAKLIYEKSSRFIGLFG